MKKISVLMDEDTWIKITILAAKKRMRKQDIINEALKNYITQNQHLL